MIRSYRSSADSIELLRQCAEKGMTYSQAAIYCERSYVQISKLARNHSIRFASERGRNQNHSNRPTKKFFDNELTLGVLKQLLDYDPVSGEFRWKVTSSSRTPLGSIAGSETNQGYLVIGVCGKSYLAHRLAWFYVHGKWPSIHIDHIDGNGLKNAIENLREATRTQNMRNNLGKGYTFNKRAGLYVARIVVDKKQIHLGSFNSRELARSAYLSATLKHFGEFSAVRSGRAPL